MCRFLLRGGVTLLASPYYLLAPCMSHTTGLKVKQLFEFLSKAVQSTKANLAVGSNCPVSIELIVVYLSILFYGF